MKMCSVGLALLLLLLGSITSPAAARNLPLEVIDVRYDTCPVMGGTPQADVGCLHDGKLYHFCCPACIKPFQKDPEKYLARLKDPREVRLTVLNKDDLCPVMGGKARTDVFKIQGNAILFFCCPGCEDKAVFPPESESSPASPGKRPATAPQPLETPQAAPDSD